MGQGRKTLINAYLIRYQNRRHERKTQSSGPAYVRGNLAQGFSKEKEDINLKNKWVNWAKGQACQEMHSAELNCM